LPAVAGNQSKQNADPAPPRIGSGTILNVGPITVKISDAPGVLSSRRGLSCGAGRVRECAQPRHRHRAPGRPSGDRPRLVL